MSEDDKDKKLEFASTQEIDRYEYLLPKFLEKVLDLPRSSVFVSDESSLWDFASPFNEEGEYDEEEGKKESARHLWRIRKEYGVDVSDIEDGNLIKIFERISR